MAKEASYVTLARFRCHWGNKKFGVFRKKGHFSIYCLNGNENASTVNGMTRSGKKILCCWLESNISSQLPFYVSALESNRSSQLPFYDEDILSTILTRLPDDEDNEAMDIATAGDHRRNRSRAIGAFQSKIPKRREAGRIRHSDDNGKVPHEPP